MLLKTAIIDSRIPIKAKEKLSKYFEQIELPTSLETYKSIAAHPDIFFCKINEALIHAPNTDEAVLSKLEKNGINLIKGKSKVGNKYPLSAKYNSVITNNYLIHNLDYTDESITSACSGLAQINVKQGYTRCNLIELTPNLFLTSDLGIQKALLERKLDSFYISSEKIILPGFKNGFFGGCCGIDNNQLFVIGSLNFINEGMMLKSQLQKNNIELIELYNGPLFDGGSILII
jgi:hypothetical protein